jgi:hypothetical protein
MHELNLEEHSITKTEVAVLPELVNQPTSQRNIRWLDQIWPIAVIVVALLASAVWVVFLGWVVLRLVMLAI